MSNSKKGKKNSVKKEMDNSDNEVKKITVVVEDDDDDTPTQNRGGKSKKADKKKSSKKQQSDVDSDSGGEDNDENLIKQVKQLKISKKKKPANKKSGFDLLMADDDDDDDEDNNDQEEKPACEEEEEEEIKPIVKPNKGKKGKKGRKDDNEDIDKVLAEFAAELQEEYDGGKKADVGIVDDSNDNKKKKKKGGAAVETTSTAADNDEEAIDEDGEDGGGGGGTVKTAAQKKKEKKERQKREAALAKQGIVSKKTENEDIVVEDAAVEVESADPVAVVAPSKKDKKKKNQQQKEEATIDESGEATQIPTADGGDTVVAGGDGVVEEKKDKKKKKTKAEREEEKAQEAKAKKKGMSAAMVATMQERLLKMREEEERLKREEKERIQREEEIETLRLENLRLEAERKEKKKQKELERRARLKAEGKLLTAKQKQDKARAEAMLEALRAQGIDLPEVGAEKRPARLGTRVRPNKNKNALQQQQSQDDSGTTNDTNKSKSGDGGGGDENYDNDGGVKAEPEPIVEKIKDAWDASSSEDESEELKKKVATKTTNTKKVATVGKSKKVESENSEDDDDDDEDGSDSDDEDDDDDDDDDDDEDDDDDADSDDEDSEKKTDAEQKKEKAWERIMKRRHAAEQKRTLDNLRAAVVCVLGHVDTGKTKILDKLRRTNVQDGEAGGITQQIGATNVPIEAIKEQTRIVKGFADMVFRLPGLLIIDTPGHESFSNLRNRGSSLCDIAILVVDIMHGLEPQTIESINLLKSKRVPFIVALNKIDRLYNWESSIRKDVRDIIKNQKPNTQLEFQQRAKEVMVQFAEQGLNAALFYENPDPKTYVNLVPTSAITGEGMGNLLYLIIESCQNLLAKRLMYSEELLATVLEVKAIPGLGTTIDAILINGRLREGDQMVVAGTDGPIVTQIRSLLMPQPMKELRVKNAYVEYKEIQAAQGVKIAAKELEKAIAGLNIYIAHKNDEVELCREEVARELKSALSHIKLSGEGVYVQASTLGSLEALLDFLKTSKIPYANIRIGPVVKRDVMKASTMLAHDSQYSTILAFDVKIERDAQDLADSLGVKIFQADIIYHLFDQFTAYRDELKRKKREEFKNVAVFPCKLKILPQFIFNSRDPIVMGVMIEAGIVKEGTPICVPSKEFLDIGIVTSIECNHKQVENARKGQEVCIKIDPIPGESPKMFGRHFEETDILTSKISRQSIDACKDYFRDDLVKADWALMVELKKLFQIL